MSWWVLSSIRLDPNSEDLKNKPIYRYWGDIQSMYLTITRSSSSAFNSMHSIFIQLTLHPYFIVRISLYSLYTLIQNVTVVIEIHLMSRQWRFNKQTLHINLVFTFTMRFFFYWLPDFTDTCNSIICNILQNSKHGQYFSIILQHLIK